MALAWHGATDSVTGAVTVQQELSTDLNRAPFDSLPTFWAGLAELLHRLTRRVIKDF